MISICRQLKYRKHLKENVFSCFLQYCINFKDHFKCIQAECKMCCVKCKNNTIASNNIHYTKRINITIKGNTKESALKKQQQQKHHWHQHDINIGSTVTNNSNIGNTSVSRAKASETEASNTVALKTSIEDKHWSQKHWRQKHQRQKHCSQTFTTI